MKKKWDSWISENLPNLHGSFRIKELRILQGFLFKKIWPNIIESRDLRFYSWSCHFLTNFDIFQAFWANWRIYFELNIFQLLKTRQSILTHNKFSFFRKLTVYTKKFAFTCFKISYSIPCMKLFDFLCNFRQFRYFTNTIKPGKW